MNWRDIVLLLVLGLITGLLFAHFWQAPRPASTVEIRYPDGQVERHSLAERKDLAVTGAVGESRLQIAQGRVRFVDGPCRNRICVHSGWLEHSGDTAACLPNRVVVVLSGGSEALDAIAY